MRVEMVGRKFGKLTVICESGKGHRGYTFDCSCDCGGKSLSVPGSDLRSGHKTSCGCRFGERRRTHGMSNTRQYNIWTCMKKRCTDANLHDYHNYGGRGIGYCPEWESFKRFWEDMKDGYSDNLTIDRKDVNGNYCKDNCRWITLQEQQRNRRNNYLVEYNGEMTTLGPLAAATNQTPGTIRQRLDKGLSVAHSLHRIKPLEQIIFNDVTRTVTDFAAQYGMTYHQLKKRLMRGWTVERALTQPLRKSPSTTQLYAALSGERRREIYKRYF